MDVGIKRMARLTPFAILFMATLLVLLWSGMILWLATQQPYLGLKFAARDQQVVIVNTLSKPSPVPLNTAISQLGTSSQHLTLTRLDLTIEPDSAMGTYVNYRLFLQRQDQLAEILRQKQVQLRFANGQVVSVPVQPSRPLSSLDPSFWVQLMVGVIAWLIAIAVFAFRPQDMAARYLLLSGSCTLVFSTFAGVYTTRELALPASLFQFLSDGNFFGGSLYAASLIALLLYYPRRIAPNWVGLVIIGVYVLWFIAQQYGLFDSMSFARRFLVSIGLLCSFGLAAIHWRFSKRDPIVRASLQWFLLSWLLGISLFIIVVLLPTLFGFDTSAFQGYAFLLILMVYLGLAFGILRYRLFELGLWWGRVLLLLLAILILIVFDVLFVSLLHVSPKMSMTLALVACGLLWLPLRAWIWEKFLGYIYPKKDVQFREIIGVALATSLPNQQQQWSALLQHNFAALQINTGEQVQQPVLGEQGLTLTIPAVQQLPALCLSYAGQGQRLFSQRDVNMATELCDMLNYAIQARDAYEAGVIEERHRIRRDLHDNISSQLVNALHSEQPQRKDDVIRNTLTDLRDIINHSLSGGMCFEELLINIRAEIAERLDLAGMQLDWSMTGNIQQAMTLEMIHGLRSILREATNNCIRHAHAQQLRIGIQVETQYLSVEIQDNGQGLAEHVNQQGQGLMNMQTRVALLGGELTFLNQQGLWIKIILPLDYHKEI